MLRFSFLWFLVAFCLPGVCFPATADCLARINEPDPIGLRAVLEQHVNSKLAAELVDKTLDPDRPSPMVVRVEEVRRSHKRAVRPNQLLAEAHVSMQQGDRVVTGIWTVTFEQTGDTWSVVSIEAPPPGFRIVDQIVIGVYLLGMLAIGWWTSRYTKTTRAYFIADGRLNHVVVGISLLTTYLSALTMMALPGIAFGKHDCLWAVQLPFLLLTAFVITRFVLVRYREAGVISVYQFLEQRIGLSARLLASLSFIVFSIARMGIVLFLPALAFHMVTGFDLLWTIIVMGGVVTLYTILGGIEAVIWTDFAQAIVMVAGALVSVGYILAKAGGAQFFQLAREHHKFRMLSAPGDLTSILTIFLILETIVQTIRIYGTQQDMTQRYMTTRSTREANRSVWISILGYIPCGFLFYFIGSALFVYYLRHPNLAVPAMIVNGRSDAIYPYFVADELPVGLAGLVIAAIFAASMSSIDACMNASSTVCVEDFYRRFARKERSDRYYLNVARLLTFVWGALATAMAVQMMHHVRQAQIVWNKMIGISTNGVLGLMALAFLPRPVRAWAAVTGFVTSYLCLFAVMWFVQVKPAVVFTYPVPAGSTICFLLWCVVGNLVCFLVAVVLDRLVQRAT